MGVTGILGAWLNVVASCLESNGALLLWPGQSLDVKDAKRLYDVNSENMEVHRINDLILESCHTTRFSGKTPKFFDCPFPGPAEFLGKFPDDKIVVVTDNMLCLLWDVWAPHITDLVVVAATPEMTTSFLRRWIDGNMTTEECAGVYECYQSQLEKNLRSFDQVLHLDHGVVAGDQSIMDEKVKGFLNSGI